MSELYNEIYSTPDVFDQEISAIDTLSDQDRSFIAAALGEAWSSFEAEFGDGAGFKEASAKTRTRFRLDLLQTIEDLSGDDYTREVRGVRLLVLYLRGINLVPAQRKQRMYTALRNLIRADLRQRNRNADICDAMQNTPAVSVASH